MKQVSNVPHAMSIENSEDVLQLHKNTAVEIASLRRELDETRALAEALTAALVEVRYRAAGIRR